MLSDSSEALSDGGALSIAVSGFRERRAQIDMADAVECAIHEGDKLIVEAGTGVGKTFAYLVPSLLSGKRVIISTGTRHLQDQLYQKDLPVIQNALKVPCKAALLKGRSNYLCLHRLEQNMAGGLHSVLKAVHAWGARSKTGDFAELEGFREDSPWVNRITSTVENCLGKDCPRYEDCFLVKARRRAQQADLVVINHHLLLADFALKEEGFGDLLPKADAIIVDEAHQLAETAAQFFGVSVSARQLERLISDATDAEASEAPESRSIADSVTQLRLASADLWSAMPYAVERSLWPDDDAGLKAAIVVMRDALGILASRLSDQSERGRELAMCERRALDAHANLCSFESNEGDSVRWYERSAKSYALRSTPLAIDRLFREHMARYDCPWIFTSATLTVGGKFQHFQSSLGLSDAQCLSLESPFNYEEQSMLCLPDGMPDPNSPGFAGAFAELAKKAILLADGGAFLLFTSHRALKDCAERLRGEMDYPLFVQGEGPRHELLSRFREAGNGVLLGAASFWEGVDVRGSALRLVIIDKLPFASPGDPVMSARIEAMRIRGGNPFMEIQLPQAVIMLKQGVGRLIRDETDHGALIVCDSRLKTRSYGKVFFNSLPNMRRASSVDELGDFFAMDRNETTGA